MAKFKTTIGLEIHIQLETDSKMFCACDNDAEGKSPNENTCPICLGMPGTLPVMNKKAVEWTIKTGIALNCKISDFSKFDRKHYFYPDLPKGYQISQYDKPLCQGGFLNIANKKIRLNRIHLEEDAGKLTHIGEDSLVDLNRAGTPLMEIVTEPDLGSPSEAKKFLQELQLIAQYLGVSEASMEKGHLRCDANIDVKDEEGSMSPIVEIKNINSFRFLERALQLEEKRLAEVRDQWPSKKSKVTRGYDSEKDVTYPQREKEEAADYRYFPEPDLPPIRLRSAEIDVEKIEDEIEHLPASLRKMLGEKDIPSDISEKIVTNIDHVRYLSDAEKIEKELALWVTEEVNAQIKNHKITYEQYKKLVPIRNLSELLNLVSAGKLSNNMAKEVFSEMVKSGKKAISIMKEKGLEQMSDESEMEQIVDRVLSSNQSEVERYKSGEKQLFGFFMGQVMRETEGKANPKKVTEILKDRLLEDVC